MKKLNDERKLEDLKRSLNGKILEGNKMSVYEILNSIASLSEDDIGCVYFELCNYREGAIVEVSIELIESFCFLPDFEKEMMDADALINELILKHKLKADYIITGEKLFEILLRNKISSICKTNYDALDQINDINKIQMESCVEELNELFNSNIGDQEKLIELLNKLLPKCDDTPIDELKKAAELGNKYAQFNLAACYECGCYCKKDSEKFFEWMLKAAHNGNADAQFIVAMIYSSGLESGTKVIVKKDSDSFYKWVDAACANGNYRANITRAVLELGKNNDMQAFKYINSTHDFGEDFTWHILAMYCERLNKSPEKVFEYYLKSAELGNYRSMYKVANCYYFGNGISKNEFAYEEWISKALEKSECDDIEEFVKVFIDNDKVASQEHWNKKFRRKYNLPK